MYIVLLETRRLTPGQATLDRTGVLYREKVSKEHKLTASESLEPLCFSKEKFGPECLTILKVRMQSLSQGGIAHVYITYKEYP